MSRVEPNQQGDDDGSLYRTAMFVAAGAVAVATFAACACLIKAQSRKAPPAEPLRLGRGEMRLLARG